MVAQGACRVGKENAHVLGVARRHGIGRGAGRLEGVGSRLSLHADRFFHFIVKRFEIGVSDRAVLEVRSFDEAVKGSGPKVLFLNPGRIAVVVNGSPAHRGCQGVDFSHENRPFSLPAPERSGLDSWVLVDEVPVDELEFVVAEEILYDAFGTVQADEEVVSFFQEQNFQAAFGEKFGCDAPARARPDDDDVRIVELHRQIPFGGLQRSA